jgi:cytochrome P450/NADPH-cytochrome P450 reductase
MGSYMLGAQKRSTMPSFVKALSSTAEWEANKKIMDDIVNKGQFYSRLQLSANIYFYLVISDRKTSGVKYGDLLDLMLSGKDPVTGKTLEEENIRYQVCFVHIAAFDPSN